MTLHTSPDQIVLTRVRGEVERQLHDSAAPEEIHEFLTRHWARLMTDIFMAKGNKDADWQAGWDTMNALLWSLSPKEGRKETTLMLRALPNLLARLQEGCIALGLVMAERDQFFERLAMLHAAVAREGLQVVNRGKGEGASAELGDAEVDLAGLPHPQFNEKSSVTSCQADQAELLTSLTVGDRMLLRGGNEDRELRLGWVSPMRGMFMFTNDMGLDALTLTRSRLETKLCEGEARLLKLA